MGWKIILWPLVIGLVLPTVLLVAIIVTPGPDDDCLDTSGQKPVDTCYCESISKGRIKQPINTFSNVVTVLVGLGLLVFLAVKTPSRENPMKGNVGVATGYATLTIFLGTGSMFLHATMKLLGGWFDNISMDVYITFILFYNLARLYNWRRLTFWIVYIAANGLLLILTHPRIISGSGKVFFGVFIGLTIFTELQIHLPLALTRNFPYVGTSSEPVFRKTLDIGLRRSPWFLLLGLLLFGIAFIVWIYSQTGEVLCSPGGFQGHGLWHALGGVAACCFFFYFRTEQRVNLSDAAGW